MEKSRVNPWFETSERSVPKGDDNSKVTSQKPQVFLVLYIFRLVLYFNSSIIGNQIKYYLAINRRIFLQIQYGFYTQSLQIHYQLWWWLATERACTKNPRKLMPGTWLLGASWWKFIKALSLYEICSCKFVFLTWGAVIRIGIWLAGPVQWHRFMLSLTITDNIIKGCICF